MTIAYPVAGDGPVTMVVVSRLISQLELAWEEPALEHFWSRFAACARVPLSGRRWVGLPDRSAAGERLDLAAVALDAKAVLDACDAGAAVLSGARSGCSVAVRFAVSYPARAQALVLAGGFAKMTRPGESDFGAGPSRAGERASGIRAVESTALTQAGLGPCITALPWSSLTARTVSAESI